MCTFVCSQIIKFRNFFRILNNQKDFQSSKSFPLNGCTNEHLVNFSNKNPFNKNTSQFRSVTPTCIVALPTFIELQSATSDVVRTSYSDVSMK